MESQARRFIYATRSVNSDIVPCSSPNLSQTRPNSKYQPGPIALSNHASAQLHPADTPIDPTLPANPPAYPALPHSHQASKQLVAASSANPVQYPHHRNLEQRTPAH